MTSRAERRRTDRELKKLGLYRRVQALAIGDPRSDLEVLRLVKQHEADLADPTLDASVREELEASLQRVRAMQLVLAAFDPSRPATAAAAN
jgi:hypothetical protein